MKLFDTAITRQALSFDALIAGIERMFVTGCQVPPRHVHKIGSDRGEAGTVLIMPAWHGGYMGIKTVNIFPGNAAHGLPGLFSTYILYSAATGQPLAQMDGDEITSSRTAARFRRAMVDACLASSGRARGVATVRRSITDQELPWRAQRLSRRGAVRAPHRGRISGPRPMGN